MDFVFESPAMQQVIRLVDQLGLTDAPVMLSGETGCGKEVVATYLQMKSRRASRPFIKINCSAIPKDLLESELFGVMRGAFTGAETKAGQFEIAHTGTIFLDELADMPMELQVKILRAVEDKQIKRVGSNESRPVDVRLISAVQKPPDQCVEMKILREDLYYRLATFHIPIPPLRQRTEAIPALCKALLTSFCRQAGRDVPLIDEEAMEVLQSYSWPGNVRQLKNEMMRLSVLANGAVHRSLLDPRIKKDMVDLPEPQAGLTVLQTIERQAVIQAIATTDNMSKAAAKLGIGRQTLYNKVRHYGIKAEKQKDQPK